MNLFKKLDWLQSILGFLILFNLAFFLWDFYKHAKLYLSFLNTNYVLAVVVVVIFCIYILLGVGNLMQKRWFIGAAFILLLDFSLMYCVPLFNNFSCLSIPLRLSFYVTWGIFIFSYIPLYLYLYLVRMQSVNKASRFTINCPELTLNRKLIKVIILLGYFLIIILPLAYFAIGVLGKFAGYNFPLYGIVLTWFSVFYLVKLTHNLCEKNIVKALTTRRSGIFLYTYGLCILLLFIFLNIPFWLKVAPLITGLLLCIHYFATQFMLFAQIAYAKIISEHYEHKTIEDQNVAARKYTKSMIGGLIIASLIAYQVAMNVRPEFQDFFDQAGYNNTFIHNKIAKSANQSVLTEAQQSLSHIGLGSV